MRKLIAAGFTALFLASGTGVALAGHEPKDGPGPNGHNTYGLCTAYFAGSDNGRAHKRNAPPFQALEGEAGVTDEENQDDRDELVEDYCQDYPRPGGQG